MDRVLMGTLGGLRGLRRVHNASLLVACDLTLKTAARDGLCCRNLELFWHVVAILTLLNAVLALLLGDACPAVLTEDRRVLLQCVATPLQA